MIQQVYTGEKFRSMVTGHDLEFYEKDRGYVLAETFVNADNNREIHDVTEHYDLNHVVQYVLEQHGTKIITLGARPTPARYYGGQLVEDRRGTQWLIQRDGYTAVSLRSGRTHPTEDLPAPVKEIKPEVIKW